MSLLFSANTLEECLESASNELKVPKKCLKYKIIEQKKTFFRKHVKIEISQYDFVNEEIDYLNSQENNEDSMVEKNKKQRIKIEDGKIIILDNDYLEKNCVIIHPCDNIALIINGEECNHNVILSPNDKIEFKSIEEKATRKIDINVSEDKMEAYITITYTPRYYFKLIDNYYSDKVILESKKVVGEYPPKYTYNEIESLLRENKIIHGIIKEKLDYVCENDSVKDVLIAKGDSIVEDIPDKIEVFFETNKRNILNNENERIDYRNMYSISNVKIGDILAQKIFGQDGHDGVNIYGKKEHRTCMKKIVLKTGEGCMLKENKVIATIEGRPSCKSGIYIVNKLYTINDVDMKSGNINFIGDVEINGSVKYGTKVNVGNSVIVKKNVEESTISACGQVTVLANALNSKITSGAEDINKKKHLEILKQYESIIEELIISVKQIKDKQLLGNDKADGEIIKILIENKFKSIPRLSMLIISFELCDETGGREIINFIREKIIGLGPINIKSYFELYELKKVIMSHIEILSEEITIPTDIYVSYSQDSTIEASGNVFITGKGQYVSDITALKNIEFTQSGAVCRGGLLRAVDEIKLKTVGSIAGVITRLEVSKTGCITADIAYQNTTFCFGEKQMVLEVASKDLKAYLGKDGMIVIDKFLL